MKTTPTQLLLLKLLADTMHYHGELPTAEDYPQLPNLRQAATAIHTVLDDLKKTKEELTSVKEELEEWRFTNRVDELCRRVDKVEAENASLRQQLKDRENDYL